MTDKPARLSPAEGGRTECLTTVNISEAKTNLSKLIELVEQGQEIVIARAGKPVARLTRLEPTKKPIRYGALKDKIWIADDFDAPLPEDFLIKPEG